MRIAFSWRGAILGGLSLTALVAAALFVGPSLIDQFWKQPPPDFSPTPSPLSSAELALQSVVTDDVTLGLIQDVGPAVVSQAAALGIDAPIADAPPLSPVPAFEPLAPVTVAASPHVAESIDAATLARLQEIRRRLEQLGAEYVIVETTDGSGRYRFHCRMRVDSESQFTRPFESIANDPLAAGETVLQNVEAWRTAATVRDTRFE
jgi:hypothetical protein